MLDTAFRFDPYSPEIDADPFPAYKILRDHHPCFWSEEARMWVLSRHADIVEALNDWQTYSSTKGNLMDEVPNRAGATLGTTDPPRHDRMRAIIQSAFTKRNVGALAEPLRQTARHALAGIGEAREFDFITGFSAKVTVGLLFNMLGMPLEDEAEIRRNVVLMVQTDPVTRAKGPENIAAFEWMSAYAARLMELRRRDPGEDLVSRLVQAEIDGERLSEREIQMTVTTLIMAGVESLSSFLTMFALNLADHPQAREMVVADPSRLPDAVEESLRFNTSAQRFRRVLMRDVDLHGQVMKKGDFVCLAYGSGNRDERQFPNPDLYDIDRRPKNHLGFGGGVHVCLGSSIARMATVTVFEEFHKAVPVYRRVESVLPWLASTTFRAPRRLLLARD
ncbi:cytochrome P450 [Telmatospirillum sp. J64-1]|uniref:cytochrome P450 n=1 Tax=Telmatospirillum sp. J64-1 TaxID=2502183 RepID=UPI00115CBBEF|nr:cytochrome P450 [Telmatospirillum sp. J64-1]